MNAGALYAIHSDLYQRWELYYDHTVNQLLLFLNLLFWVMDLSPLSLVLEVSPQADALNPKTWQRWNCSSLLVL